MLLALHVGCCTASANPDTNGAADGQKPLPKVDGCDQSHCIVDSQLCDFFVAPGVGKFVVPIALNVGFAVFFLLSLTFGYLDETTQSAIPQNS